jgi:type IV pilus assembly protein PilA
MSTDPIEGMEALYRAAVGPKKAAFYVPKFVRFDKPGASKASWNWSAFLVSFYWFLYRRMYGYWAIYCLLIPIALATAGAIATAISGSRLISSIISLAPLGYTYGVIPIFANSLYHRTIRQRIETLRQKVPERAVQLVVLENGPHTSNAIWIILSFVIIATIGILAAIAIPAYQDYTIRAQVTEGLVLANPVKTAVADRYASDLSWPESLDALGISQSTSGNYVAAITVERGTILIKYGKMANSLVANHVLSLRPTVTNTGDVVWACGYAASTGNDPPTGAAPQDRTDVAAKYLPASCRTGGQ